MDDDFDKVNDLPNAGINGSVKIKVWNFFTVNYEVSMFCRKVLYVNDDCLTLKCLWKGIVPAGSKWKWLTPDDFHYYPIEDIRKEI